jgi:hypothetical protein
MSTRIALEAMWVVPVIKRGAVRALAQAASRDVNLRQG